MVVVAVVVVVVVEEEAEVEVVAVTVAVASICDAGVGGATFNFHPHLQNPMCPLGIGRSRLVHTGCI